MEANDKKNLVLEAIDLYKKYREKTTNLIAEIDKLMPCEIRWIINEEGNPFNTRMKNAIWELVTRGYGYYYLKGCIFEKVNTIYEDDEELKIFKEQLASLFAEFDILAEVTRNGACEPGDRVIDVEFSIKK